MLNYITTSLLSDESLILWIHFICAGAKINQVVPQEVALDTVELIVALSEKDGGLF
jgi:hypothetical protein